MIRFFIVFILFSVHSISYAQNKKEMKKLIDEAFVYANDQYKYMMTQLPNGYEMPQRYNFKTNKIESGPEGVSWWCTGFYPGSLVYIFEHTKDETIRKEIDRALKYIEPNQFYTGNHDLGFMIFNSFGNAYKLFKNEAYKPIIFNAATSLAKRYIPEAKVIQSWGNYLKSKDAPVIIDNMLNLELLLWATEQGADTIFHKIAVNHADQTLKNHFRSDYSSYHVVNYDKSNGNVLSKKTRQGFADESAWARGQGWGLYGYTMMYRFTKDSRYLKQATKIADYILNHPRLPIDKIPYWDFDDTDIPNTVRDASAAALIASALLELGQYVDKNQQKKYVSNASLMLKSLSSPTYRPAKYSTGGFLLLHSTGALPLKSEIDVPLIYADYYYLEALKRYKEWYL